MAHEIANVNGLDAFARAAGSQAAWHGLGQTFQPTDSDEVVAQLSGLNYRVLRSKVRFVTDAEGTTQTWGDQHVLFRSDNQAPLAVVSDGFQIHHQPTEALVLLRERARAIGAELDTAMALKGGSVIVATAVLPAGHAILGTNDVVRARINYASAFDGSMRTTEFFSNERIVCANTLRIALTDGGRAVRTSHRSQHDNAVVEASLGIEAFTVQMRAADELARVQVSPAQADNYFSQVYLGIAAEEARQAEETTQQLDRLLRRIHPQLVSAPGAQLATAQGTAWGILQAVTHDQDHVGTSRNADNRAVSALFGRGDQIKQRAWDQAQLLVAA